MNAFTSSCILAGSVALASAAQAAPQHSHDDHAAHAAPSAAIEAPAERWVPDAALRDGMGRVHEALDDLGHYEMGHMPASMAVERAVKIEDAITYMFANCKLDPVPDAALHRILIPLLAAAQDLEKDSADVAAVARMRAAVTDYPRLFADPLWSSPPADPESGGDASKQARGAHEGH
ncbi:MAG: DnrO protein [Lysobacteraceae bacterium]|jgi:hypothetical protein|nr:MAG: DnrO protein [Xanthomonadaceae bacterium]